MIGCQTDVNKFAQQKVNSRSVPSDVYVGRDDILNAAFYQGAQSCDEYNGRMDLIQKNVFVSIPQVPILRMIATNNKLNYSALVRIPNAGLYRRRSPDEVTQGLLQRILKQGSSQTTSNATANPLPSAT